MHLGFESETDAQTIRQPALVSVSGLAPASLPWPVEFSPFSDVVSSMSLHSFQRLLLFLTVPRAKGISTICSKAILPSC